MGFTEAQQKSLQVNLCDSIWYLSKPYLDVFWWKLHVQGISFVVHFSATKCYIDMHNRALDTHKLRIQIE